MPTSKRKLFDISFSYNSRRKIKKIPNYNISSTEQINNIQKQEKRKRRYTRQLLGFYKKNYYHTKGEKGKSILEQAL